MEREGQKRNIRTTYKQETLRVFKRPVTEPKLSRVRKKKQSGDHKRGHVLQNESEGD